MRLPACMFGFLLLRCRMFLGKDFDYEDRKRIRDT